MLSHEVTSKRTVTRTKREKGKSSDDRGQVWVSLKGEIDRNF